MIEKAFYVGLLGVGLWQIEKYFCLTPEQFGAIGWLTVGVIGIILTVVRERTEKP